MTAVQCPGQGASSSEARYPRRVEDDPRAILAVDPDARRSGYTLAVRASSIVDVFDLVEVRGGGTGKTSVEWQTILGQLSLIEDVLTRFDLRPAELLVIVETQPAKSPRSSDVEELRRVRYHFEAACELLGVACKFVTIAWADAFVPGARRGGAGAQKKAYVRKAQVMTHGLATNEDQCASFGMLVVEIEALGFELCIKSA